jgi:hypothetical protein
MLGSEEWMPRRMLAETKAACGWFHMKPFTQNDPLTDAELDRLGEFLKGGRAMNLEQLDGFFAALIAGPETVMLSEYYSAASQRRARSAASTRRTKSWGS